MKYENTKTRLVREVPLWGVLTAVGIMVCQFIVFVWYGGQFYREQTETRNSVVQAAAEIKALSTQLSILNSNAAVREAKDAEHDRRLDGYDRRIDSMEAQLRILANGRVR